VLTWAWSPLELQADMGVLLTFMFVGNMAAALALVPALSHFLLRREGAPARARATRPAGGRRAPASCSPSGPPRPPSRGTS
jgi:hypothetical protein